VFEQLDDYVADFPRLGPGSAASNGSHGRQGLDSQGTQLWNLSTKLRRQQENSINLADGKVLSSLRAFAFLLLDAAHDLSNGDLTSK
jgi:hypothetical protein